MNSFLLIDDLNNEKLILFTFLSVFVAQRWRNLLSAVFFQLFSNLKDGGTIVFEIL